MKKWNTFNVCANVLKELRAEYGLSKSKMANRLNLDDRTYSRYESGESAPSISEFLQFFEILGKPAMPIILRNLYPDRYSEDVDSRTRLIQYFSEIATPKDIDLMEYIIFSDHGSIAEAQIQLFSAIDHLPMRSRLLIAKLALNLWEIEENNLVNTDQAMPDMEYLKKVIISVQQNLAGGGK